MLLALLLAASAPVPALALPGLNGVRLDKGEAELYGELLSQELQRHGFKVMSSRDIGAMLGIERQKELAGCGESSCITELMGALGVDGVLLGDVGRLDDEYTVSVKVLSTKNGEALALHTGRAGQAKAVPHELAAAARDLAHQLAVGWNRPELEPKAAPPEPAAAAAAAPAPSRRGLVALIPILIGAAAILAGLVLEVQAGSAWTTLMTTRDAEVARSAHGSGKTFESAGWILVAAGSAAILAGAATYLWGRMTATPAVAVTPGGGSFGLSGVLP